MTRPGDRPPGSRRIPVAPRPPRSPEEESIEAGHELRDMRTRQVVRSLLLLAVSVTAVVVAITVYEAILLGGIGTLRPVVDEPPQVTPPPQPRLEITNGEVLNDLRAQEDQRLNNYTWIDQAAGTVGLPIERALELTLQRGLPVREQPEGRAPPGVTLPQGSSSGRTLERIP